MLCRIACGAWHGDAPSALDFCSVRGIVSDIKLIPAQQINEAYERMLKSDVQYRFVIDSASLAN